MFDDLEIMKNKIIIYTFFCLRTKIASSSLGGPLDLPLQYGCKTNTAQCFVFAVFYLF